MTVKGDDDFKKLPGSITASGVLSDMDDRNVCNLGKFDKSYMSLITTNRILAFAATAAVVDALDNK